MKTRSALGLAVAAAVLAAAPLAPAGDWPAWRGPHRDGTSEEKGLVSTWSKAGENLVWKAELTKEDVTARATPVVFDGRACISARAGSRAPPPGDRRLLRRGHREEALGAAVPRPQHHGPVQPRGLGQPRRRPRDRLRLRPERGRAPRGARPGREDRLAAPARRGARPRLGLRRPHPRAARRRGPARPRRRRRGLGRHGGAPPALRGVRQEDGRGALGLDPLRRAVRGREQQREPHRRARSTGAG